MASGPRMTSIKRDDSALWYRVGLDNGFEGTYPYVWLRDNCQCPQCYHPTSYQRFMLMADLDPGVKPASEALADDGRVLRITWPDQHRSDFDAAWLSHQRFSEMEKDVVTNPEVQTWGAEMNGNIPVFDFEKLLQDDLELYNWLNVLNTKGLALVKGAPTKKQGAVRQVAERIAYLKPTKNGLELQVVSRFEQQDLAYTTKALGLHADMPCIYNMPGIQMLHCVEKTTDVEGGESQFVDGMHVAAQIEKEFPEAYQLLTTQEVDFRCNGSDYIVGFHVQSKVPTIQCNKKGEVERINYNDTMRAPYMTVPVDKVTDMYKATKLLNSTMYRPENLVCHQLVEGEMVTFNNWRVLHARSAYTVTGQGTRHLEGGYVDWDEAHSRMRVLRERLFGDVRL